MRDTAYYPLRNALEVHFALKKRGSSFSQIARQASKGASQITPQNVRGVVYGYTRKNAAEIWAAIDKSLVVKNAGGQKRLPHRIADKAGGQSRLRKMDRMAA